MLSGFSCFSDRERLSLFLIGFIPSFLLISILRTFLKDFAVLSNPLAWGFSECSQRLWNGFSLWSCSIMVWYVHFWCICLVCKNIGTQDNYKRCLSWQSKKKELSWKFGMAYIHQNLALNRIYGVTWKQKCVVCYIRALCRLPYPTGFPL